MELQIFAEGEKDIVLDGTSFWRKLPTSTLAQEAWHMTMTHKKAAITAGSTFFSPTIGIID